MSILGNIYGGILAERLIEQMKLRTDEEQGIKKARGCVDQIFTLNTTVEKYYSLYLWIWKKSTTYGSEKRGNVNESIKIVRNGKASDRGYTEPVWK